MINTIPPFDQWIITVVAGDNCFSLYTELGNYKAEAVNFKTGGKNKHRGYSISFTPVFGSRMFLDLSGKSNGTTAISMSLLDVRNACKLHLNSLKTITIAVA